VSGPVSAPAQEITPEDESLLEQVYTIYGSLSAFQLSNLTHVPGGPWDIATKTGGNYALIHDDLIKQHYKVKRAEANRQAAHD
jgi:uncharacterized phage-associated protein